MTPTTTIINNVPFGQKDYRVYCDNREGDWDLLDMRKRRVEKLGISLRGFFDATYKNKLVAGRYAEKVNGKGTYYPVFLTLTYHSQDDWSPKDISTLVDYYRKDWKQRLKRDPKHFRYLWVAEMQKRGVIHYHMILWCPRGKKLAKPDLPCGRNMINKPSGAVVAEYGAGWRGGMSNIVGVRKGVVGYLGKYLSKGDKNVDVEGVSTYFPKGARILGMGGLDVADRRKIAFQKLPAYVRAIFDQGERVCKVKGGYEQGVVSIVSPYTFQIVNHEPVIDPYSPIGWSGGRLTCIFISYERTFVLLSEKEEYLNNVSRET